MISHRAQSWAILAFALVSMSQFAGCAKQSGVGSGPESASLAAEAPAMDPKDVYFNFAFDQDEYLMRLGERVYVRGTVSSNAPIDTIRPNFFYLQQQFQI